MLFRRDLSSVDEIVILARRRRIFLCFTFQKNETRVISLTKNIVTTHNKNCFLTKLDTFMIKE